MITLGNNDATGAGVVKIFERTSACFRLAQEIKPSPNDSLRRVYYKVEKWVSESEVRMKATTRIIKSGEISSSESAVQLTKGGNGWVMEELK